MPHSCHDCTPASAHSRRDFLRRIALGAGVSLLWAAAAPARAGGKTDVLLLSCMDFRLMDEVQHYMANRGLVNRYDHIVLAGASLGAVTDRFPAWNTTFWEHLDVAIKLHHIHKLMVMDHRDCGAYKVVLGEDFGRNPERETVVHMQTLKQLGAAIADKYPELEVELLLMGLDGAVETIAADSAAGTPARAAHGDEHGGGHDKEHH